MNTSELRARQHAYQVRSKLRNLLSTLGIKSARRDITELLRDITELLRDIETFAPKYYSTTKVFFDEK